MGEPEEKSGKVEQRVPVAQEFVAPSPVDRVNGLLCKHVGSKTLA
jgi:hypothetical protein